MQVSCDGVSESRSTSISLDVYSSRMKNCRVVYPHRIVRPLGKYKVDNKAQLKCFIDDISHNKGRISQYVADNLKRATGRDCLNHASSYPCEYCFRKGVRFTNLDVSKTKAHLQALKENLQSLSREANSKEFNKIEKEIENTEKSIKGKSHSHIVWPFSTYVGEPRTHENMREIVNRIEREGKLPPDEAKGVVGKSPFWDLPYFSFVSDVPCDYLHCVCLGVGKSLIKLTFQVGEAWPRNTKRKLSNPSQFNKLMLTILVVREFSRRNRALDFSVMKAQEFRNHTCFFFPIIITCIEKNQKERKLWLQFAFMIRSCIVPDKEFRVIPLSDIHETCMKFYKLYESLFGEKNCTYNTHITCSHLLEMRYHGPLTLTSAFGFEDFYGELRHAFTPGTQSTLKQCMSKILLKRKLAYHCCEKTIFYSKTKTNTENNTLIYQFKDLTHVMYQIVDIEGDYLICNRQGRYKHTFPELSTVNWSQVGVYKKGPISREKTIRIHKNNVDGKVLEVQDLLITCPNNVLREK